MKGFVMIYLTEEETVEGIKLAEREYSELSEEELTLLTNLKVKLMFTLGLFNFYELVKTEIWRNANNI